jgi:DNA-binding CsgD family transcriptional regulator
MSGGREAPGPEYAAGSGPRIALINGDRLATFGLRRMVVPFADRVSVVDQVATADLVLVDPPLTMAADAVVLDLLDAVPGGVVAYTWGPAAGPVGPIRLRSAGWPLRGWLSKGLTAGALVRAIERIHGGEWVGLDAPPSVDSRQRPRALATLICLSPRESQVVSLIVDGLSNHEIADQSYLSIHSVKTYIRSAYQKMGVERRTQAVTWAFRHDVDGVTWRAAGPPDDQ